MKRKLTIALTSVLLVVGMLFAFCACSSYGSVKRAYTNKGYEEIEISDEYKKYAVDMFGEEVTETLTIHVLQKKASEDSGILDQIVSAVQVTVIAEFKSTDELNEQMKKHVTEEDAKKLAEEIQKLKNVSGNCVWLFSTPLSDGFEIFTSTKK